MPLASGIQSVISAVGKVVSSSQNLTKEEAAGFHAGQEWAKVATAFFKNGANPKWGSFADAENAFKNAAGKNITESSFISAWKAYAAKGLDQLPGGSTPGGPALSVSSSPIGPLTFSAMMSVGSQSNHVPAATHLFTEALAWTLTGKIKIQPPGAPPPSPVDIPWI